MNGKELLSVLASACAVIAFVAGTAASTIYAGVVYAGLFLGGALLAGFVETAGEVRKGEYVTTEAMRDLSMAQLYLGTAVTVGLFGGIALDYVARPETWIRTFGFAQFAGLALMLGGGYMVWREWAWYQGKRHKKCPDCARQVLAEARKCQYCAYRFDATEVR